MKVIVKLAFSEEDKYHCRNRQGLRQYQSQTNRYECSAASLLKQEKQEQEVSKLQIVMFHIRFVKLRAERVGFEPTVPLRIHYLSRVANSTTLAPLRELILKYIKNCF